MAIRDETQGSTAAPGNPQTAMSAAMAKSGALGNTATPNAASANSPSPGAAPSHSPSNVGSGRNPEAMNQPSNAGAGFSWRAGTAMRTLMSRSPASEVLNKLQKAFDASYRENGNETFEFRLIPLDMAQNPELSVSALVLTAMDKLNPQLGVAYHTLILAASTDPIASKFEQINGKNVEIIRTVSEAFDETMNRVVAAAVQNQYPQAHLYNADAEVVPADFKLEDPKGLWDLAANAAWAVSQELQTKDPNFSDINVANAANDSTLVVRTMFNQPQSADAVGAPLRTDIVTDFSAVPINQGGQQQNLERQTNVSRLGGFMDIVWDAPTTPTGFGVMGNPQAGGWSQGQQPNYQRYAARFVLTLLDSRLSLTLNAQLLALVPALALREGNQWVHAWKPLATPDGAIDMKDIGAIGYEVNYENDPSGYGSKIDTKSANFKDEHLFKLIASSFKAGMLMSLDVPECGPQTWYNGVFAAAAEGNMNAERAICEAADKLTNMNFGRYFNPQQSRVAVDENNRIHLGYYTGANGERRDMRDIDYLAVLNLVGGRDPGVVKDFSDTYLRREYHLALRLSERLRIIRALFPDVVVTGYARRVTFTAEFINALANGCKDAGLTMRAANNFQDLGAYERASGGHLNTMIMSSDASGVFNRGGMGSFAGNTGGNRTFGQRW